MNLRKITGYALLAISLLAWAALPLLPFLSMEATMKAALAGGIFIFAEITWWLAVALLGKEIVQWFRLQWSRFKGLFRKPAARAIPVEEREGD